MDAYPVLPASSHQNNFMPTTTDGSIVLNSARSTLNTATNTSPSVSDGMSKEDDKSRKRKTYEEQNTHCILPEGSRRDRKKSRRTVGAEDENTPGLKKQNVNKKGKGTKGKK